MPLHLSAFAFGLTVIAMLLNGQVFNSLAHEESHDDGQECLQRRQVSVCGHRRCEIASIYAFRGVSGRSDAHPVIIDPLPATRF